MINDLKVILILTLINTKNPTYDGYEFPTWTVVVGWLVNIGAVIAIPSVFFFHSIRVLTIKEVVSLQFSFIKI